MMNNKMLMSDFFRNALVCLVTFVILIAGQAHGRNLEQDKGGAPVVEIQLAGESLKDAATVIAKQTGYQVVIEKEWAEMPVAGLYKGVTIENFFQRVLKGKNISIISNDEKKIIIVRLFGNKKLDTLVLSNPSGMENFDPNAVDLTDGQPISEIRELLAQYEADFERWKNDPDAVDPMDGQKVSEIKALQAQNDAEMERWKNNPNAVDPMDGQKVSEIKALQAQNDTEMERWKNDPEAVDPMDGQKVSEIKALQAQNDAEMERWKNDPEAVDPESGIKVSVLRAVYEQQLAEQGQ